MLSGMWANGITGLLLIFLFFGFGKGIRRELHISKIGSLLLLIGVVLGDSWQLQIMSCRVSVLPLFLWGYLVVEGADYNWKENIGYLLLGWCVAVIYASWFALVPLEPDLQVLNHSGLGGVCIGLLTGCFMKVRARFFGVLALGTWTGAYLVFLYNQMMLSDHTSLLFLDGRVRDEMATAVVSGGLIMTVRAWIFQASTHFKRKWETVPFKGDVS
jgi:hypothetical protein